ncbi:Signal transduction histidine kinase [Loktanella fryxellensis]|uniref:histidine kinase n=1 Tax=Loktanella fryxellensis TaxID=245187 RepID=A0A1H7YW14_9RHOB|nr:HAMP domain-containing sensor histidine kinase [Loktanella fryxellensis]SEM50442.1 Signal transduction histidine kinase [Loktanella fryxellensis]
MFSDSSVGFIASLITAVLVLAGLIVMIRKLNRSNMRMLQFMTESIDAIGEGIVVFDRQDRVALVNPRYSKMMRSNQPAVAKKSRFIGKVSHELRTPLTVINGYIACLVKAAERAAEGADPDRNVAQIKAHGARIQSAASHMRRIVEDLLDWSNNERGRLVMDRAPFAMDALLRDVTDDFRMEIERKGLVLETAIGGAQVMGDRARLKQVICNLLSNALRFTDAGRIVVTLASDRDEVRMAVADTGIGVAPQDHARIFETFHQVDNSDARTYGGLGLGLAIVAEIVRQHGGRIQVDSDLGTGAVMTLRLPTHA